MSMYNIQGDIEKLRNLEKFTQKDALPEPVPIATFSDSKSNDVTIFDDSSNKVIKWVRPDGKWSKMSTYGLLDKGTIHLGNSGYIRISDDYKKITLNMGQFGDGKDLVYSLGQPGQPVQPIGNADNISNKSTNNMNAGIHTPSTSPLLFPVRRG